MMRSKINVDLMISCSNIRWPRARLDANSRPATLASTPAPGLRFREGLRRTGSISETRGGCPLRHDRAGHETDDEGAEAQAQMNMQRQHRRREADDQEGDRDNAHNREQRDHRSIARTSRTHYGAVALPVLALAGCGRAFLRRCTRSFRESGDGGGVYGLMVEHAPMYRHCRIMRLASKMRMDLSASCNNFPRGSGIAWLRHKARMSPLALRHSYCRGRRREVQPRPLHSRNRRVNGHHADTVETARLTHMRHRLGWRTVTSASCSNFLHGTGAADLSRKVEVLDQLGGESRSTD